MSMLWFVFYWLFSCLYSIVPNGRRILCLINSLYSNNKLEDDSINTKLFSLFVTKVQMFIISLFFLELVLEFNGYRFTIWPSKTVDSCHYFTCSDTWEKIPHNLMNFMCMLIVDVASISKMYRDVAIIIQGGKRIIFDRLEERKNTPLFCS